MCVHSRLYWLLLFSSVLCSLVFSQEELLPPLSIESESQSQTKLTESFYPQWILFRENFKGFTGSLDEYLNQVEAFGISFEDLPNYLTFLTTSLQNYSDAIVKERIAGISLEAELAAEKKKTKFYKNVATVSGIAIGIIIIQKGITWLARR